MATFTNQSDDEFLNQIDDKRQHSPIIEELCQRLERLLRQDIPETGTNMNVSCPVCEASLRLEYDDGNKLFEAHTA